MLSLGDQKLACLVLSFDEVLDVGRDPPRHVEVRYGIERPSRPPEAARAAPEVDRDDPVARIQERAARRVALRIAIVDQHVVRARIRRHPLPEPALLHELREAREADVRHVAEALAVLFLIQRSQEQRRDVRDGLLQSEYREVVLVRQDEAVAALAGNCCCSEKYP